MRSEENSLSALEPLAFDKLFAGARVVGAGPRHIKEVNVADLSILIPLKHRINRNVQLLCIRLINADRIDPDMPDGLVARLTNLLASACNFVHRRCILFDVWRTTGVGVLWNRIPGWDVAEPGLRNRREFVQGDFFAVYPAM